MKYHLLRFRNQFLPTVPTFAVRETDVSRHNGGTSGASLKPLTYDSALRALSSLGGLRGAPEVPPLSRETLVSRTANVGTVGKNWLRKRNSGQKWVNTCIIKSGITNGIIFKLIKIFTLIILVKHDSPIILDYLFEQYCLQCKHNR